MDLRRLLRRKPDANTPADGNLRGDITSRIRGKIVDSIWTNGRILSIRMADGGMVNIAWVNENGEPVNGRPLLARHGVILRAEGMRDIISTQQAGAPPVKK